MSVLAVGGAVAGGFLGAGTAAGVLGGAALGAGIGGTIGGSLQAAKAADRAGQLQREGFERADERAMEANQIIRDQFDRTEAQLQPYIDAGVPAINRQQALLGLRGVDAQRNAFDAYSTSPGFEWRRDQIMKDVNRTASATGQLHSGRRHAALVDRLQGLYDSEYNNYFNQLGTQTGVGLSGASALAGVGQNAAAGQAVNLARSGQAAIGAGQALADARLGRAEAFQSGIGDLSGALLTYGMGGFKRPVPQFPLGYDQSTAYG